MFYMGFGIKDMAAHSCDPWLIGREIFIVNNGLSQPQIALVYLHIGSVGLVDFILSRVFLVLFLYLHLHLYSSDHSSGKVAGLDMLV